MGLGGDNIQTWDEMKKVFLKKYQDYCKGKRTQRRNIQNDAERG
jgi:hypothetical protein